VTDLPTQGDFDDFAAWSGRDVLGPDGDRLGAVDTIFLDEATGVPEWVLVSRDDGPAFVPLAGASVEESAIRVEQDADRIAAAPRPEVGETLSVADEKRLYEHYGLEYSQAESSTVLPEGAVAGEPEPEPEPEPERPRLRKADMSPRNLSSATPSPLPPAPPQVIPPEGGFHYDIEESRSGRRIHAIQIALAGAIAALIAVLAWRRRRR
jgi:hypothetical protein